MELSNDISVLHKLVRELLLKVSNLERKVLSLEEENAELRESNQKLGEENKRLKEENGELRGQIGLNSKNSHKPPSSDGYSKKTALPKTSGKKQGGQKGHKGKTLEMVRHPDEIVRHYVRQCSCCGKTLDERAAIGIGEKRQVFDIPTPKLAVVEHQVYISYCCKQRQVADFPLEIAAPVQYGNRLLAMSSVLNTDYRLPFKKISQLFEDLYGYAVNGSTLIAANESLYDSLAPVEEYIKEGILASEVAHFDETGARVAGKLHWFHTACTPLHTYLFVHTHRGKEALQDEASIFQDFSHWAVHDCWASYFAQSTCQHSLCNAHLLRELFNLVEQNSIWATQMQDLLFQMYQQSQKATQILADKPHWIARYEAICKQADEEEPPPQIGKRGKPKNSKGRNLLNRLVQHQAAVLAFAFEQNVPFTNNLAEQALRCIKVKLKVAMSFRTFEGAQIYARIQTCIATFRKQGLPIFYTILNSRSGAFPVFQYC